jgi:hypothetical protein
MMYAMDRLHTAHRNDRMLLLNTIRSICPLFRSVGISQILTTCFIFCNSSLLIRIELSKFSHSLNMIIFLVTYLTTNTRIVLLDVNVDGAVITTLLVPCRSMV